MDVDFTEPRCILSVGRMKSGKSNSTKYFILKNSVDNPIFKLGIVFSKTGKIDDEYNYIPDENIYEDFDPMVLDAYNKHIEQLQEEKGESIPNFIIFDDMLGHLNQNDGMLLNTIVTSRHRGTSIFLNCQYLKGSGSSTTLREVVSHAILFNSKSLNTITGFYENFGQLFNNIHEFKAHFLKHTSEKYTAMLFDRDEDILYNNYNSFLAPDMTKFNIKLEY